MSINKSLGPHSMTEFLGYPMEQQYRTLIIDMLVAIAVLAVIVLPSFCCQVSGPMMKPRDDWEDIIERHRKEAKAKENGEKKKLLKKKE